MLAVKEIDKKKLMLYIFIIIIMLSGTVFFIYQNLFLTSTKNKIITKKIINEQQIDIIQKNNGSEDLTKENLDLSENNGIFLPNAINLNLLSLTKFKNLKEDSIQTPKFEVGKNNIFEYHNKDESF